MSELGLDWYLFGAQAALLYGATRMTADVDVTIRLGELSTAQLVTSLEQHGFGLRLVDPAFLRTTRVLPLLHKRSKIPADIVLAGPGLEDLFIERSTLRDLGGISVPVAAVEDLVVMKVLAGRDKDQADVREILEAQHADAALIRDTLRQLEAALGQSDLLPLFERLSNEAARR